MPVSRATPSQLLPVRIRQSRFGGSIAAGTSSCEGFRMASAGCASVPPSLTPPCARLRAFCRARCLPHTNEPPGDSPSRVFRLGGPDAATPRDTHDDADVSSSNHECVYCPPCAPISAHSLPSGPMQIERPQIAMHGRQRLPTSPTSFRARRPPLLRSLEQAALVIEDGGAKTDAVWRACASARSWRS